MLPVLASLDGRRKGEAERIGRGPYQYPISSGPTVAAVYFLRLRVSRLRFADRRQSRGYKIAGGHSLGLRAAALALRGPLECVKPLLRYSSLPSTTGFPCGVRRYASAQASLRAASASPLVKPFA